MNDDDARRQFLTPLLAALRAEHGDALNHFFDAIDPSRGLGLSIAFEGEPGMAQVAAVNVDGNVVRYADFASPGTPHYQLMIFGDGAEYAHTNRTSCVMDVILEAVRAWRVMARPPSVLALPRTEADRRALEALARARRAPGQLVVRVDGPARTTVAAADRARLDEDVASVSAPALFASFPRDDDGALTLGETALLARYASAAPLAKGREAWLVAVGPARRKDGDVLALALATPLPRNEPHRWDDARWLWDARFAPTRSPDDERARWGVTRDDPRAQECLARLDEGRFAEAFAVYDVGLAEPVLRILAGQPPSVQDAGFAEAWRECLRRALGRAAPWRFAEALGSAPPRRKGETEWWLRLFALPGQRHQRKASLMLVAGEGGRDLRLAIDWTASNDRLPILSWARATEHDLARLGLDDDAGR